jgi:hypothetical protein
MSVRSKAIVMNAAILTGFGVQYWRGHSLSTVVTSGIFIFVIANLLMFTVTRKTAARG